MSDERKPVICPWCGWEMVAREGQDIFHGKYNAYVCDGCEAVSPIAYSEDAAYVAATRTPPNRPLTHEQVLAMDPYDAVWMISVNPAPIPMRSVRAAEWVQRQLTDRSGGEWMDRKLLFADKPAPADIEAARKEANHERANDTAGSDQGAG